MYRVDRLNKKYEKMIENVEDEESMGPLESTIKHLKKRSRLGIRYFAFRVLSLPKSNKLPQT